MKTFYTFVPEQNGKLKIMKTLKIKLAEKIYNNNYEASHDNVYHKISEMIDWAWENWTNDDWEEKRKELDEAPLEFIKEWLENWDPEDDGFDSDHVYNNL